MIEYFATYQDKDGSYPIIRVTFCKGHFKYRTETKTGEVYKTFKEAQSTTGILNSLLISKTDRRK